MSENVETTSAPSQPGRSKGSKHGKRAKVDASEGGEEVVIEVEGMRYTVAPDYEVLSRKGAVIPYAFYVPYSIPPSANHPDGAIAYRCIVDSCGHVCLEKEKSITTNMRNHIMNVHLKHRAQQELIDKSGGKTALLRFHGSRRVPSTQFDKIWSPSLLTEHVSCSSVRYQSGHGSEYV
jgi:hypothetical protein